MRKYIARCTARYLYFILLIIVIIYNPSGIKNLTTLTYNIPLPSFYILWN